MTEGTALAHDTAGTGPALRVDDLVKTFGGTIALRGVSFEVAGGQVMALLGHNGSGKSTVIKILAGYHRADRGTIDVNGVRLVHPVDNAALRAAGVGILHQDLGLVDTMSVVENVRVDAFSRNRLGKIQWAKERDETSRILRAVGLDVDPSTIVGALSAPDRVGVGIARALQVADSGGARAPVIVLDEPTAALGASEVNRLFTSLRRLRERGCAVVIVTHKPREVLDLADRVTVLRDGAVVAQGGVAGLTEPKLAELIIGNSHGERARRREPGKDVPSSAEDWSVAADRPLLRLRGVSGNRLAPLDMDVWLGEVVGLTGLLGSGFEEVPGLVFGARRRAGAVSLSGVAIPGHRPWRSVRAGMAFVSGDRLREGGIGSASLAENVTVTNLHRVVDRTGRISGRREHRLAVDITRDFGVVASGPSARFSTLSGGNQQKALIGRWVRSGAKLLLMHEPMSGVDVGAVADITAIIKDFAAQGGAVVVGSGQVEDLARLCDRVLVFGEGHVIEEVPARELTASRLAAACYRPAPSMPA